jgi:hypothetical protein
MQNAAPILQAIASLAWVGFAFTVLFAFRPELGRALRRLRKGKLFGQEFELDEELEELQTFGAAATEEVEALPPEQRRVATADQEEKFDATIKEILQQASNAPKIALMTLSVELERYARQALATRGLLRGRPTVSLSQALTELHQYGFPPNLSRSLKAFDDVRNKIVHGAEATDADALSALDTGMTILRALNLLPNEIKIVYHPGVDIFSDEKAIELIPDAKGVILENTSPGGVMKTFSIFPTTRAHFQKGKRVAWEWNMQKVWPAAWYRDPDTGEIKQAWVSAGEFVGRHLDDI